jgi:hypothetical protein
VTTTNRPGRCARTCPAKEPDPAIGQALAGAEAGRAQGSDHICVRIASGADQRPEVVALTGFIGADVRDNFTAIGGCRARAGHGRRDRRGRPSSPPGMALRVTTRTAIWPRDTTGYQFP